MESRESVNSSTSDVLATNWKAPRERAMLSVMNLYLDDRHDVVALCAETLSVWASYESGGRGQGKTVWAKLAGPLVKPRMRRRRHRLSNVTSFSWSLVSRENRRELARNPAPTVRRVVRWRRRWSTHSDLTRWRLSLYALLQSEAVQATCSEIAYRL